MFIKNGGSVSDPDRKAIATVKKGEKSLMANYNNAWTWPLPFYMEDWSVVTSHPATSKDDRPWMSIQVKKNGKHVKMRNFRENLRTKANYGIKNILLRFGYLYLPWKGWCLSFSWIPGADSRTAPSQSGLLSACSHGEKIDDNQSINILFSNMVEVTVQFVGQSLADKLWDPDIFAGLWSERKLKENKIL